MVSFSVSARLSSALRTRRLATSLRRRSFSSRSWVIWPMVVQNSNTPSVLSVKKAWSGVKTRAAAFSAGWRRCVWSSTISAMLRNAATPSQSRLRPRTSGSRTLPSGCSLAILGGDENLSQHVNLLQRLAGAAHDAGERILGDLDRHLGLLREPDIQSFQQGAAAGQGDAALHDVGYQLRRRFFDAHLDFVNDLIHRVGYGLADIAAGDLDDLRQAGDEIAPAQLDRALADGQAVLAAGVLQDGLVDLVARGADRAADDDAFERDDRHFGGAAADVDDHAAGRLGNGQAGPDRRRHGLLDQERLAGAGADGRVVHGALLDFRHTRGDADHDARTRRKETRMHLADEVAQHLLHDVEVGNHTVLEGTDGDDVGGRSAHHALGVGSDGQHLLALLIDGYDGGFGQHHALALHVDQRVGRAQIDSEVF